MGSINVSSLPLLMNQLQEGYILQMQAIEEARQRAEVVRQERNALREDE